MHDAYSFSGVADGAILIEQGDVPAVWKLRLFRPSDDGLAALDRCGAPLSRAVGRWSSPPFATLRIAPGEWLIRGCAPDPGFIEALKAQLHHLVNLTPATVAWRLSGDAAAALLARGTSIDLRDRAFPSTAGVSTLLARIPAVISREGDCFEVLHDRAWCAYVGRWMREVSRSFHGSGYAAANCRP